MLLRLRSHLPSTRGPGTVSVKDSLMKLSEKESGTDRSQNFTWNENIQNPIHEMELVTILIPYNPKFKPGNNMLHVFFP